MKKNKTKIMFIVLGVVVLFNIVLIYKNVYLYTHMASKCEDYSEVIKGYKIKDTITINRRSVNNYLELDGFKVENKFSKFKKEDKVNEDEPDRYILEEDEEKCAVYFSVSDQMIELFKSNDVDYFSEDEVNYNYFISANREGFLKKNNITDDLDYLMFIKDNYYLGNRWTDSKEKIQDSYAFNLFTGIVIPKIDSFSIIDGDFRGYILNNEKFREIHLIENNQNYTILLIGDNLIDDQFIKDIVSSFTLE